MAILNTPTGYYDRFPENLEWKKVLFNPGLPVQSAEVIETQSIQAYQFSLLALSIFNDGTYLNGGDIAIVSSTNPTAPLGENVSIAPGQMYALGYVHDVPSGNVLITGIGLETVSLVISEVVITAAEDPTLNDPAIGAENFGLPGADRLQFGYQFLVNSTQGIVIATFLNGQLVSQNNQSNWLNQILAILALRTYEQSGSFLATRPVVTPNDLSPPTTNPLLMSVTVNGGVGYIQGVRQKNQSTRLPLNRTLDTALQLDEPVTFSSGTLVYTLDNPPIQGIQSILAIVQSPTIPMIRGTVVNGQDAVPSQYLPMASIVSAVQGVTTYVQGTDFARSGNYIHWLPGGSQPATGTSYNLVVTYTTLLTKAVRTLQSVTSESHTVTSSTTQLTNSDIQAVSSVRRTSDGYVYVLGSDYNVAYNTGYIDWIGTPPTNPTPITVTYTYWNHTTEGDFVARDSFVNSAGIAQPYITPTKTPNGITVDFTEDVSFDVTGGHVPINSQNIFLTYNYYLSRVDIVGWRVDGILEVIEGVPAQQPTAQTLDASVMPICTLTLPPEAFAADVVLSYADNLTMYVTEQRRMADQVADLQFDVAQFQLYQNMQNITTPTDKRGIFADNLATPFLADVTNSIFGGTFDFIARTFSLPRTGGAVSPPPAISNGTGATLYEDMWFVDFTEVNAITQPYASVAQVINQYSATNLTAQISLSPSADISVQTTQSVEGAGVASVSLVSQNVQNTLPLIYAQVGSTVTQVLNNQYDATPNAILNNVPLSSLNAYSSAPATAQMTVANSFSRVTTNIQVNLAQSVSQATITVTGSQFQSNDRAISLSFDGNIVPLTPVSPTVSDPNTSLYSGCVVASPTGTWTATFQIPPNTAPGLHTVEAIAHSASDDTIITSLAAANYLAQTYVEDITTTISDISRGPSKAQTTCQVPLYGMCSSIKLGTPTKRAIASVNGPLATTLATVFADATEFNVAIPGLQTVTSLNANGVILYGSWQIWEPFVSLICWTTWGHYTGNTQFAGVGNIPLEQQVYEICSANPLDITGNAAKITKLLPALFGSSLCSITMNHVDPLAETFQLSQDSFVTSIDLFFAVAPTSDTVKVFICETEVGIPNSDQPIATAVLSASSINTGGTLTKFTFPKPVFLNGGTEYAFVVATDDTLASVYTAVLGKQDLTTQALITGNPAAGAMLQSPNNSTWQLLPGYQMQFNINIANFTTPTATLSLGQISFAQESSRFSLLVPFGLPEKDSSVTYQYSLDNATWINFPPLAEVDLGTATSNIYIRILMSGNNYQCPTVGNLSQMNAFIWNASGCYVHREFTLQTDDSTIADLYVDTYIPGNTTLTPAVSYDNGTTWHTMTEVTADAVQISDTLWTRHYTWDNGSSNEQNIVTRIQLASTVNFVTPYIQNYRVIAR